MKELVYLKDSSGTFRDPETGLTIVKNAEVPLVGRRGKLTQAWLNAGGLKIKKVLDVSHPPQPGPSAASSLEGGGSSVHNPSSSAEEPTAPPRVSPPDEAVKKKGIIHRATKGKK